MAEKAGGASIGSLEASKQDVSLLERWFKVRQRGSTPRTEIIAGITSFLAAAYLLVVIPKLLATGGVDAGVATTATIIVFVCGTMFMALYGNLPFLVGPGIGGSVIVGTTLDTCRDRAVHCRSRLLQCRADSSQCQG